MSGWQHSIVAMVLAGALFAGCAAKIPKVEHDAALAAQRTEYEERLRVAESSRQRESKRKNESEAATGKAVGALETRVDELESTLAEKQRLLDDVTTQLVELQDAFTKLSRDERKQIEGENARGKAKRASVMALEARFGQALSDEVGLARVEIEAEDMILRVRFKDGALYSRGSTRLASNAKGTVERLATLLKGTSESTLRFDVHTDSIGVSGERGEKDTWALTQAQGQTLVKQLQKLGVDPSRLSYTSFGQYRPVASNDNDEGRAQNRRVELFVAVPAFGPREAKNP